jgi:hypothetical protein
MLFYSHINGQIQGVVAFKREQVLTNRFHDQRIPGTPLPTMTKLHANRPKILGPLTKRGQNFFLPKLSGPFLGLTQSPYVLNTRRSFLGIKAAGTWSCLFTSSVAKSSTRVFIYVPILFKILSAHPMKKAVDFVTSMCDVCVIRAKEKFILLTSGAKSGNIFEKFHCAWVDSDLHFTIRTFFAVVLNSSQGEFCSLSLLLNQAGTFQTNLKRTD